MKENITKFANSVRVVHCLILKSFFYVVIGFLSIAKTVLGKRYNMDKGKRNRLFGIKRYNK